MSPPKGALADAWDDDWESLADKEEVKPEVVKPVKLSKAERRAQHAQLNREIWESAENPEPVFLQARNPPIQPTFKPAVTVLARKPTPHVLSRNGGMAGLSLEDDDDSEEERQKKAAADFEERKIRAAKERAEKERKYAEARERIFGSPAASEESRSNSPSKPTRGKGRGRGGRESQPRSSNEQSPARTTASGGRQLFEPSYAPKPGSVYVQRKEDGNSRPVSRPGSRPSTPSLQEKPVREPRGPARGGGRGFASRGNHGTLAGPS
ncbi:hypothetical protein EKO04_006039 [Ascochyta lentis]|uniref:SUZ domain-containing protein n=1 Tax=Ascochyta lentis TaxID=205686 RepID=A0A8H7J361_9PLEO|nr:hypothetical protein EKO04_006039 [Ascochyta lentis]